MWLLKLPRRRRVRTSEGRIITAGHVDNVVYGSTMCAERAAIFRAVAEGYTRFSAIAIAARSANS
jgi:cytidine deaminase